MTDSCVASRRFFICFRTTVTKIRTITWQTERLHAHWRSWTTSSGRSGGTLSRARAEKNHWGTVFGNSVASVWQSHGNKLEACVRSATPRPDAVSAPPTPGVRRWKLCRMQRRHSHPTGSPRDRRGSNVASFGGAKCLRWGSPEARRVNSYRLGWVSRAVQSTKIKLTE